MFSNTIRYGRNGIGCWLLDTTMNDDNKLGCALRSSSDVAQDSKCDSDCTPIGIVRNQDLPKFVAEGEHSEKFFGFDILEND